MKNPFVKNHGDHGRITRVASSPPTKYLSVRMRSAGLLFIALAVTSLAVSRNTVSYADSALPLLGKFDAARIDAAYPPSDEDALGELAKLVYQLRALDPKFLIEKLPAETEPPPTKIGDAVKIEGEIKAVAMLKVPSRLEEFLEFSRLQVIDIDSAGNTVRVITTGLAREASAGDRVGGTGVVVQSSETDGAAVVSAVAASRVSWFPESPLSVGWKLLSQEGVDVSALASVSARNRKPLEAEDGDAFYTMLAAAHRIRQQENSPAAKEIDPVSLLKEPKKYGGDWVQMTLETVQVTRVAVTESHRQVQLGSDHYYQIDAVGDLGKVVVQIKRPDGDDGPPATFENRYPVSLVSRELPEFLRDRIRQREGGNAMVAEINAPVVVEGFFFRLWSYTTDYMKKYGGGDQFGPLIVAARIEDRPLAADPAGVSMIGWLAAFGILAAIALTWIWNLSVSKQDQQVRAKRKQSESEQLRIPDDAAL